MDTEQLRLLIFLITLRISLEQTSSRRDCLDAKDSKSILPELQELLHAQHVLHVDANGKVCLLIAAIDYNVSKR